MKKLFIIFAAAFAVTFSAMTVNAADQELKSDLTFSVTPVVGYYGITSGNSDSMFTYGAQVEARKLQVSFGAELLGFTSNVDTDGTTNELSGINPNIFARLYILNPDDYWIAPFVGAGIGYSYSDRNMGNGEDDGVTWNGDAGAVVDIADFGSWDIKGIAAARYQRFGNFSEEGAQAIGGYTGLRFEF